MCTKDFGEYWANWVKKGLKWHFQTFFFSTEPLLSASQPKLVGFPGVYNCNCYLPEGNYYSCLLLQTVELMATAH